MKFRVDTINGGYFFKHVKGLAVVPESRMIAVVNEEDEPIAQFNGAHIIAMGEVNDAEDGTELGWAGDRQKSLIQQVGLVIPGGR